MMFNTRKNFDATPNMFIDKVQLELVESYKLLGVQIRSDLSWMDNTVYICKKGFMRLWILRRLKLLGAAKDEIMEVYVKQVRPVLELAVPVWHHGLTQNESTQIERVQKCALHIVLGSSYSTYENALIACNIQSLAERKMKICEKFAKKSIKSSKFQHWYVANNVNVKPWTETSIYQNSPLPEINNSSTH